MGDASSESSSERSEGSSGSESSGSASASSSNSSSSSDASRSAESMADIRRADQAFARNSSITGTMGYARLVSAGKSSFDYIVRKRDVLIGRTGFDADCQIRSDSRLVSRHHARLFWDPSMDQWAIECMSRKNGLLVDGTPLVVGAPPLHLRSKNLIEMGDASFFFLQAADSSIRTGDIERTESMVLDMRNARKKKRTPAHSHTQSMSSKKRNRPSPVPLNSKKLKKHRSSAADIETDDSSEEEQEQSPNISRRDDEFQKRRGSNSVKLSRKSSERSSDASADRDDRPAAKSVDTPSARIPAKRKKEYKPITPSIKRKVSASQNSANDSADGVAAAAQYREEWNKKEKTDFGRALFAVGVDPIKNEDGEFLCYDWERFRMIAELPKKSDAHLVDYYLRVIHDVKSLLEEEEREKRTKGPRTKHKPGCDCIVCKNTRKSRRKKREENNQDEAAANGAAAEEDDEAAVKSTGRAGDRLVGLVTAQKLRVRMGLHEALRQVDSDAGVAVFDKLRSQNNTNNDLPSWWIPGLHDRALLIGARKHGVAMWQELWKDEDMEEFSTVRAEEGSEIVWPSQQAAMKRLREVGSSINAEIRRLNKKQAKRAAEIAEKGEEQKTPKSKGKGSAKDSGKSNSKWKGKSKADRKKANEPSKSKKNAVSIPKHRSAYTYDDDGGADARTQSEASVSRASSRGESDGEAKHREGEHEERSQQLSNDLDDDDDEMEIEVEEEEDVVVEEEYDDDDPAILGLSGQAAHGSIPAQQTVDTGDEGMDRGEQKAEYETSSESGSD